jgi:D-alanyl-D-alanine dipeptidase
MKSKLFLIGFLSSISLVFSQEKLAEGFVYLDNIIPDIVTEMRYCTENNFVGETIDGYEAPACIISTEAAMALKKIQDYLKEQQIGLKIYDAYRPQTAVNHFMRWAKDLNDIKMKQQFYPEEEKQFLFQRGYISSKSGHSRGSTVDISLVYLIDGENHKAGEELDMGTPWDFFSTKSWPTNTQINEKQFANRMLLQKAMLKFGFKSIRTEWWHFTLKNEPFPNTYFDFQVR